MKTSSIIRILLCALLSAGVVAPAVAGPGPHETYVPVTTMKQAESIQPGTRIAFECPVCGRIKTMTADKGGGYLHGFTCDYCKTKFVVRTDAHGGIHGGYVCEDDAGHKAKLFAAL
jgi:hypothetical protein